MPEQCRLEVTPGEQLAHHVEERSAECLVVVVFGVIASALGALALELTSPHLGAVWAETAYSFAWPTG